jgi:F-type H+-transporting ATPase subunit b
MIEAPDISMILILAIFLATVWVLNRFLLGPLSRILREREEEQSQASRRLAQARAEFDAAAVRIQAAISAARREALKLREERRTEGQRLRDEKIAGVKDEMASRIARAVAEIEGLARKAASDLPARVAALARQLAEKILGRAVAA